MQYEDFPSDERVVDNERANDDEWADEFVDTPASIRQVSQQIGRMFGDIALQMGHTQES